MVGVGDTQGSKERGLELQLAFLIGVGFGFRVVSCEAYTLSYCTFQNIKIDFFRIAQILKSNKFGREFVGPNKPHKTERQDSGCHRLPSYLAVKRAFSS